MLNALSLWLHIHSSRLAHNKLCESVLAEERQNNLGLWQVKTLTRILPTGADHPVWQQANSSSRPKQILN